jgi:hypothetical protein
MSVFLASRREEQPSLAAVSGGLAAASAVFALMTGRAAVRLLAGGASGSALTMAEVAQIRGALEQIGRAAQAGTVGDAEAASHAFAIIARRVNDCRALLGEGN